MLPEKNKLQIIYSNIHDAVDIDIPLCILNAVSVQPTCNHLFSLFQHKRICNS